MKVAFVSDARSATLDALTAGLRAELAARGEQLLPDTPPERIPPDVNAIFNLTDAATPRANYIRASASNFVCTLIERPRRAPDERREIYAALIKTMSNLLACVIPDPGDPVTYLVTPEMGFREIPHGPGHTRAIVEQVAVLAGARFVIGNDLVEDLPASLHGGNGTTAALARIGRALDGLKLLPSVLPLEEILSEHEIRLIQKVFGIRQLSYGNLSARHDATSFWMSGRGVDKGNLAVIGRDILLVTGYDESRGVLRLSVPPGADPAARVSVDAIEHWRIYSAFPGVGAIVHVHAWLPGIESTLQSYPCGSHELAEEVLTLVRRAPDPCNAVVGLRNHGVTITGPDLDTIYARVAGRLEKRVPMV